MLRLRKMKLATAAGILVALTCALLAFACATTREEPPAPPPPPVDTAGLTGPARTPAPEVDLNANQDAANPWFDASAEPPAQASATDVAPPQDAGSDARAAGSKKKH
jgi:hypothetical protein